MSALLLFAHPAIDHTVANEPFRTMRRPTPAKAERRGGKGSTGQFRAALAPRRLHRSPVRCLVAELCKLCANKTADVETRLGVLSAKGRILPHLVPPALVLSQRLTPS